MIDIEKLETLAQAATPGEWEAYIKGSTVSLHLPDLAGKNPCIVQWNGFDGCDLPLKQRQANCRYMSAANPATILALCEIIRELTSLVEGALEDETEFETEWNKDARAAVAKANEFMGIDS